MSERGQATVLETIIGLMPIVMTWALVQAQTLHSCYGGQCSDPKL
jgi:hypothetical protein